MTIYEFADIIDKELEVRRYPNQNERWIAQFRNCDVSEGAVLMGIYGTGKTPIGAIQDYTAQIRGKKIVFNAMSPTDRREYTVPQITKSPL